MENKLTWDDDKLDRQDQANVITAFLENEYKTRFYSKDKECRYVLNIDSQWGYGKTFFLKRWKQDLQEKKHIVLYYDAWENDFSKDPLLSFLSEITNQLLNKIDSTSAGNAHRVTEFKEKARKLAIASAGILSKKALSALIFGLLTGVPSTRLFDSLSFQKEGVEEEEEEGREKSDKQTAEKIANELSSQLSNDIFDKENSRKKIIEDFKNSLSNVIECIKEENQALPIFIFIDELDRCRPNFTIDIIECVKHIFSVNHLFFVFATDGDQLQATLEKCYGQKFDAEIYFKKIFDREIQLREPDNRQFVDYLEEKYLSSIQSQYIESIGKLEHLDSDCSGIKSDIIGISESFNLSLRDQEQVCASLDALIKARTELGEKTHTLFACFFIVLWIKKKSLFLDLYRLEKYRNSTQFTNALSSNFPNRKTSLKFSFINRARDGRRTNKSIDELIFYYITMMHTTVNERMGSLRQNRNQISEVMAFNRLDEEFIEISNRNKQTPENPLKTHLKQIMYL